MWSLGDAWRGYLCLSGGDQMMPQGIIWYSLGDVSRHHHGVKGLNNFDLLKKYYIYIINIIISVHQKISYWMYELK